MVDSFADNDAIRKKGDDFQNVFRRADKRMYQNKGALKRKGRHIVLDN